jgi:hypothetical protein
MAREMLCWGMINKKEQEMIYFMANDYKLRKVVGSDNYKRDKK